jgi:hypothetical protein
MKYVKFALYTLHLTDRKNSTINWTERVGGQHSFSTKFVSFLVSSVSVIRVEPKQNGGQKKCCTLLFACYIGYDVIREEEKKAKHVE